MRVCTSTVMVRSSFLHLAPYRLHAALAMGKGSIHPLTLCTCWFLFKSGQYPLTQREKPIWRAIVELPRTAFDYRQY